MISRKFYIFCMIFVFQKCINSKISLDHTNNVTNPQTKEHTQVITANSNKSNNIVTKQTHTNLESIHIITSFDNSDKSRKSTTNQTDELITESSSLSRVETTSTPHATKCNLQMSNGDTKSVRKDRCECAEGFEIIDYDEFKSTIAPTCVEVLTESTLMPTTAKIKLPVNNSTPSMKSTEADYLHSTKTKGIHILEHSRIYDKNNTNIIYTSILNTTKTDVSNPSTSFTIKSNSNVNSTTTTTTLQEQTEPTANLPNPSVKILIITQINFDESLDNITDTTIETTTGDITHMDMRNSTIGFSIISSSTVNPELNWQNKSDSTSRANSNIIISAPIRRKEDLHPIDDVERLNVGAFSAQNESVVRTATNERKPSQLIYHITGGVLIGVMFNVLVILCLWNFRVKGYYKILHSV